MKTSKKQANKRWEQKQHKFCLRISPQEIEIWNYLNKQPNKNKYIKTLIKKDMGSKNEINKTK